MTDREQKIIDNMNLVHYIVHKHFPQYITNQEEYLPTMKRRKKMLKIDRRV